MSGTQITSALEEAALSMGRLDARVSASPLREAWQVRACLQAGTALAAVDGTPTLPGHVAALMCGARVSDPDDHAAAAAGLTWWRLGLSRVPLSDGTSRLIGRSTTTSRAIAEMQAEWDGEDAIPRAARSAEPIDPDAWMLGVGRSALSAMSATTAAGGGLRAIAAGLKSALRIDDDPGFHERAHATKGTIAAGAREAVARMAAEDPETAAESGPRILESVEALEITPPRRLGACHAFVPDAIVRAGLSVERLSCLTGATRRLGMEGRLDDRSVVGFLRTLAREAAAGLVMLDALETTVGRWVRDPACASDPRSRMPEVIHAMLVLPAVDVDWLCEATGMDRRVAQKFVRRLADAGLVARWAQRRTQPVEVRRSADVGLWMASSFEEEHVRAARRRGAWRRPGGAQAMEPAAVLARLADVDLATPMTEVFRRFDREIADIDRDFGALVRR